MHHLRIPGRASYPRSHVALVVSSAPAGDPRHPRNREQRLTRWHAIAWTAEGASVGASVEKASIKAEDWWGHVTYLLSRRGVTWVWTVGAGRALALLGVWDLLERRQLVLAGTDPTADQAGDPAGDQGAGGVMVLEDPPTVLQVRAPDLPGTLQFVDVRNYGVSGWKSITPGAPNPAALQAFVVSMLSELQTRGWGSLKLTAGSQAWHAWNRAYRKVAVFCHNDRKVLSLERDAYFGGRCEAFRLGKIDGPVYHLDIKSCYPWVGLSHDVPVSLLDSGTGTPPNRPEDSGLPVGLIADVTVRTDTPCLPCRVHIGAGGVPTPATYWSRDPAAPYHTETVWPTGQFRTALAEPELTLALLRGQIVRYHRWASYHLSPVLREAMAAFLDARSAYATLPVSGLTEWVKAMAVGLVGKMGQTGSQWVNDPRGIPDALYGTWLAPGPDRSYCRWRSVAGVVQREEWYPDAPDAVPSIAAWVTSLARARLDRLINVAGRSQAYYTDTDSLFVGHLGYCRLDKAGEIRDNVPGYLRLLGQEPDFAVWGYKHYQFGGRVVHAGVPIEGQQAGPYGRTFWQAEPIAESLKGRKRPSARETARAVTLRSVYHGGQITEGGVICPWKLGV